MNFGIFLYNIKRFNIFQSTQFNQDLQIECVAKPASSQLIELIESWHSIQFNIEASLNGTNSSGFRDLTIPCENFSLPPTTVQQPPAPTRTLCDVSALALSLNFEDPGS